tara:strand:- start:356 stop:550 length:195 start_codon:yes stop_codon:yes gene_type:complete
MMDLLLGFGHQRTNCAKPWLLSSNTYTQPAQSVVHFFQPIDGVGKQKPLTHGLAAYWLQRWGLN